MLPLSLVWWVPGWGPCNSPSVLQLLDKQSSCQLRSLTLWGCAFTVITSLCLSGLQWKSSRESKQAALVSLSHCFLCCSVSYWDASKGPQLPGAEKGFSAAFAGGEMVFLLIQKKDLFSEGLVAVWVVEQLWKLCVLYSLSFFLWANLTVLEVLLTPWPRPKTCRFTFTWKLLN